MHELYGSPRRPWRHGLLAACMLWWQGTGAALAADDDEGDSAAAAICLPSRGSDPATPPAVRLAGVYQPGNSGNPMADLLQGVMAPMSRYLPGEQAQASGGAKWLYEGVAAAMAGRHDAAKQHFERCVAEAGQRREGLVEAACRNNLGAAEAARGRYAEARTALQRAAQQYRDETAKLPGEEELRRRRQAYEERVKARALAAAAEQARMPQARPGDTPSTANIAAAQQQMLAQQMKLMQGEKDDPDVAFMQQASLARMAMRAGTELTALNQGSLAYALGQWEEAYGHLKAALVLYEGKLSCRPAALDELLRLRERLPRKEEVTALLERYRRAGKASPEQGGGFLYEVGSIALAGSNGAVATAAVPAVPAVPAAPARAAAAGKAPEPAADNEPRLFSEPLSATSETALQSLLAEAARQERGGQVAQARRSYASAALRAHAGARGEVEAAAHAALMRLEAAAGHPAVAIFHGKRAANLLQELRSAGAPLERAARRAYLRDREQTYGLLAQLLMQAQRLPEAERVLQMLKEDEGRQFTDAGTAGAGRARLPETAVESAQRSSFEQSALALRRSDEERAAVAADRTFALLLAMDRARLEKDRVRAALEVQELLQRRGAAAGGSALEQALRRMPREFQQAFLAQFADGGRRWAATLRELNEDAPKFQATPATPQQLAAVAEVARRADEARAALAPVLEAMRRQPSESLSQMMQRDLDPANMERKSREQASQSLQRATAQMQRASALGTSVMAAQQDPGAAQRLQTATALTMQVYIAALGGREDNEGLAQIEGALRGASPEMLDGYLQFARGQAQQMMAARPAVARDDASAAGQAAPSKGLVKLLEAMRAAGTAAERRAAARNGGQAATPEGAAAAVGAQGAPRAPGAADPELLARVQARLEQAVERARAAAGPTVAQTLTAGLAPPGSKAQRDTDDTPAIMAAEPMGRLWRIEQSRLAQESRALETLAQSATALESARAETLPPQPDDTSTLLAGVAVPTVLLYYLPHDTGVDVLLVHAQGRRSWRLAVPRAELDRRIAAFGAALRDTSRNPRPEAAALYELLYAPVAQALAPLRPEVVALSLSGTMRFVPFAALHDGQGWLVERHAFAVVPGGRLAELLKPASARWQVAAFGASRGGAGLPALAAVPQELGMVVRQGNGAGGALPGRRWLDGEFTAQSLRTALAGDNQVVHIASHFKFEPGDAAASFLLLGDGQRLSLQALGGPDYRFDRTELVTLSACQTGLSADNAYGQEVDGLAALLMAQGAPSVLASLWQVNDGSTALLMGTMYGVREQRDRRPLGRALALQQAQLAMLRGATGAAGAAGGVGTLALGGGESRGIGRPQDAQAARAAPPGSGTHPYHWAPFVLMGSWQ